MLPEPPQHNWVIIVLKIPGLQPLSPPIRTLNQSRCLAYIVIADKIRRHFVVAQKADYNRKYGPTNFSREHHAK